MTDSVTLTWGSIAAIVSVIVVFGGVAMGVVNAMVDAKMNKANALIDAKLRELEHRWRELLKPRFDRLDRQTQSPQLVDAIQRLIGEVERRFPLDGD